MPLKTQVKVGKITNLSDARYCSAMGVNMMGFVIDPNSKDYVNPELFNAITGWISGIELVGETGSSSLPNLEHYEIYTLQVSNPELIPQLKDLDLNTILAINLAETGPVDAELIMQKYKDEVVFFLIEKEDVEKLSDSEKNKIGEWVKHYPIMLGFGFNKDNIDSILDLGVSAIAIYGSSENRPGYKSYDELADVLEAIEIE